MAILPLNRGSTLRARCTWPDTLGDQGLAGCTVAPFGADDIPQAQYLAVSIYNTATREIDLVLDIPTDDWPDMPAVFRFQIAITLPSGDVQTSDRIEVHAGTSGVQVAASGVSGETTVTEGNVTIELTTFAVNLSAIGAAGAPGRSGTLAVGTVTALPAGSDPVVTNVGTATDAVWDIALPSGADGAPGDLTPEAQALADQANASANLAAQAAANLGSASSRSGDLATKALSTAYDVLSNGIAFTSRIEATSGDGTWTMGWVCSASGGDVAPGQPIDGFMRPLKLPAGVDELRASLWEIDTSSSDQTIPHSGNSNYTQIGQTISVTPDEALTEAGTNDAWPAWFLVTPDSPEQPWVSVEGKTYVSVVDAYIAGVWTPFGHGQVSDSSTLAHRVRGLTRHGENTSDLNLGSPARLCGWLVSRALHITATHTGAALNRAAQLSEALSDGTWTAYHAINWTDKFLVSGNYIRWTADCDQGLNDGDPIEGAGSALLASSGLDRVECQLWRRLKAYDASAGPGHAVGDHYGLPAVTLPVGGDGGLGLTVSTTPKACWFPFDTVVEKDPRFIYWPQFRGFDSDGNPAPLGIGLVHDGTATQNQKGWYYTASSNTWSAVGSDDRIAVWLGYRTPIASAAMQEQIDGNGQLLSDHEARLDAVEATFTTVSVDKVVVNATSGFSSALGDLGWSATVKLGIDMQLGQSFQRTAIPNARLASGAAAVYFYVYDRPLATAENADPGTAGDILNANYPVIITPEDFGVPTDGTAATGTFVHPQRYSPRAGYHMQWFWYAVDADGNKVGSGNGDAPAGTATVGQCGRYIATNGHFAGVGGNLRLAYKLEADALQSSATALEFSTATQVTDASAVASGLSVQVSATATLQGTEAVYTATLNLAAPTSGTATAEPVTLAYNLGQQGMPYMAALNHANIVITAVTDTSLAHNPITDYIANLLQGGMAKATSGSSINALVTYAWSNTRYDIIYLDVLSGSIGVVQGTERVRDARELMPALGQAGRLPLFTARVTASGVILTAMWGVDGIVARPLSAQVQRDQRAAKDALQVSRAALQQGAKLAIITKGDSITAMQAGAPDETQPNGQHRDRARSPGGYLVTNMLGADLYDGSGAYPALPLYDTGDEAGQNHTQFGYVWEMIRTLQARYASEIVYDNFAIAGTTDGSGANNGLDPDGLAAFQAQIADRIDQGYTVLALLAYGMNNLNDPASTTAADMTTLAQAAYASGAEVMIVGVWHPNAIYMSDLTAWRNTNKALRAVAAYPDPATSRTAAYIDTMALTDLGSNVTGLPAIDFCGTNGLQHPGPYELKIFGRATAQPLL